MTIEDRNYYHDRRVLAAESSKWYERFDEKSMTAIVVGGCDTCPHEPQCGPDHCPVPDCDGDHVTKVRCEYEVCPLCEGKGTHVNPSIDSGGISGEDFARDPDFYEDYVNGVYDVPCNECNGKRVVPVCADDAMRETIDKKIQDEADYQAICAAERSMGA